LSNGEIPRIAVCVNNETNILRVVWLGTIDYAGALALQEAIVRARQLDRIGDTLLLLEHPHVYTLGRGADERYLIARRDGVPVHRVSRGGQVTWHGPGQLVGYPILKLEGAARDVHRYLRALEDVMIDSLDRIKIAAARRPGLTGVWADSRKIGSIGVGIRRWVTLHGFALNVCPDLSFFDAIVPCGISGCVMTSIAALGYPEISPAGFGEITAQVFAQVFGYARVERVDPTALAVRYDDARA
jgi:lipoyl(octanoyl) transferase